MPIVGANPPPSTTPYHDWMSSREFKFIEVGIYFFGGVYGMISCWGITALLEYYSAPTQYDF